MRISAFLVRKLIALSKRTPYFDIYNAADDSLYMARDWLMPRWMMRPDDENEGALKPKAWVPAALRLHHIVRPDLDRHFHDHPSTFVSIVLRGGYTELRPTSRTPNWVGEEEDCYGVERRPGSIALRRFGERHRIASVAEDTVTLVLWFRKRQSWGFFTPAGKIHWREYPSVHNTTTLERAA